MQNKGVWQNRRIVSEKWVEQSTEPSQNLNPGYGLLWWLPENLKGFAALGYLDTNLYVIPEQELIVVRMQSKPAAGNRLPYEPEALLLFNKIIR
jgi:CubicO group peptidase (beta-lactamase class C family)